MSFSSVERPDTTEARQGPSPTAQLPPLCKKTPAPSGYRAPGISWYTSSKGMPRHAHGRWALMQVGGADVRDELWYAEFQSK